MEIYAVGALYVFKCYVPNARTRTDPSQAGAVAAFTVDVLVYPLDTLKTRYQSQDYIKTYAPGSSNKALAIRGLYQGIGSVVLATLPAGE